MALIVVLICAMDLTSAFAGGVVGTGTLLSAIATPQGTTFVVNTLSDLPDPAPGNGICEVAGSPASYTLRAAIMEANLWPGDDTITFSPSLPAPSTCVLTRTREDDTALNGDLDITSSLTIQGRGAS